jgi:hypothetical protein
MNSNENSHDPLVDQALVGFDLAAEHHIANCQPCQSERERVENALRQFATVNREYASRPQNFWEQQAARIRAARSEAGQRSGLAMRLVPSAVVLLVLAFAVLSPIPGSRPVAVTTPAAVQTDSDHELLMEVERAVQTDTPPALEPATLLMVEESDGNLPLNTTSENKEPRSHEN